MQRLPRCATITLSTLQTLKQHLEDCGLHPDYIRALVDKWNEVVSAQTILLFARLEELALNLAIRCAIEPSAKRKHVDSQGADNSHHNATDRGAGPSAKGGKGRTGSSEADRDGYGDGDGDDEGRDNEDTDELSGAACR